MQTDRAANSPLEFRHHRSLGSRACAREPALGKLGASEVAIPRLPCDSRLGTWPFNFAPESSYRWEPKAMPGDPKECREHAARCAELAIAARTPQLRTTFLGLSKNWEKLAIQLEDAFAKRAESEAIR